jgi:hypothetical protein
MANYVKGIGDPQTRVNEIIPKFDAQIFRFLAQTAAGVCWPDTASRFAITNRDRGVQIGTGMVCAHGYFGLSDAPTQINFVIPSSGSQFARIIAEINLSTSPHRFSIRATAQSTSSNIGLTQQSLTTTPSGIFQVPLYLVTINSNGVITHTDQRVQLQKVEHARLAEDSTRATNATNLVSGGTIASNVTAVTQAQTSNATLVATTAFVRTAINNMNAITNVSWSSARGNSAGNGEDGITVLPNGIMIQYFGGSAQSQSFPVSFPTRCVFVGYAGNWGDGTSDNITSRVAGINRNTVSRTGFTWNTTAARRA